MYVGQGEVARRIKEHRSDPSITSHSRSGTLYITWAQVDASFRNGIERYLADTLQPKEGSHHPNDLPIAVNLPG